MLFGSSARDRHVWCIYRRTFSVDENCSQSQWFGRKPAIIARCSVLSPEIVMHDDAYIGGRSENNIKCVVHDHLRWKNQTTRYILSRHWLYEWFPSFVVVEYFWFFHGAIQLLSPFMSWLSHHSNQVMLACAIQMLLKPYAVCAYICCSEKWCWYSAGWYLRTLRTRRQKCR